MVRRLSGGKSRLESPVDWPVEGLLMHAAVTAARAFASRRMGSEEACRRFGLLLMLVQQELGIDDPPELSPAQAFVSA